jgi:hypothetical protein
VDKKQVHFEEDKVERGEAEEEEGVDKKQVHFKEEAGQAQIEGRVLEEEGDVGGKHHGEETKIMRQSNGYLNMILLYVHKNVRARTNETTTSDK